MRITLLLLALLVASSSASISQTNFTRVGYVRTSSVTDAPQCVRESLSLKQGETDAAMGGVRVTDFMFTNTSSSACTLNGYPRVELLNRKGRVGRRAVNSNQLPDDSQKMPPRLVTLEPGKTARFRVHYNSGGAGYTGKPCPIYPKVRVLAPGITRPFVLRSDIQSCPKTDFQVSSVRSGTPQ